MCQNGEQQQSPELATPRNDRVHNLGKFNGGKFWTMPIMGVASSGLCHFTGWPVQHSFIFSLFWHIEWVAKIVGHPEQ